MSTAVASASDYSASAAAWAAGPMRVYGPLAAELLDRCPVPLAGRVLVDVGAGTGALARLAAARGARVVAVDAAMDMVRATPVPGVLADARHLPLPDGRAGVACAAFCLNHVDPPVPALRELARVTAPGGAVLASTYGHEDEHPVRGAVDAALARAGWTCPTWYLDMQRGPAARLGTVPGMARAASEAGLAAHVEEVEISLPGLAPRELVAWRLGMAHVAPFVAGLDATARRRLLAEARDRLGPGPPPLVRNVVVLVAPC